MPRTNSIWPGIVVLDSWKYVLVPLGFFRALRPINVLLQLFFCPHVRWSSTGFLPHFQPSICICGRVDLLGMPHFMYFQNALPFLYHFSSLGRAPRASQNTLYICMFKFYTGMIQVSYDGIKELARRRNVDLGLSEKLRHVLRFQIVKIWGFPTE